MTTNPYATPTTDALEKVQTDHDRFITGQVTPMLEGDERILWTAHLVKAPNLILQVLFAGLIMLLFIKNYLVAVTNKRIILMRTSTGMIRPKMQNRSVEHIRWDDVDRIEVGGFANNRSLRFVMKDRTSRVLRIAPWAKFVSGQKGFFEFAQNFDRSRLG